MPGAQSPRRRADSASSQTSSLESFSCASSSASGPFGTASSDSEQLCLSVVTSSQLAKAVTLSEAAFKDVPAPLTSSSAASAVNLDTLTVPSTAETPASLVPVPPHESATPVAASSPAVSPTTALSAVQTPTTPTAAAAVAVKCDGLLTNIPSCYPSCDSCCVCCCCSAATAAAYAAAATEAEATLA